MVSPHKHHKNCIDIDKKKHKKHTKKQTNIYGIPGIQAPRVANNGSALTSARLVSTLVFGSGNIPLNTTTLALMQFGQLINHDFESTTQYTFGNKRKKK